MPTWSTRRSASLTALRPQRLRVALFSEKSGLKDIMIILQKSIIFLKKGGKLFLEHAPFQAKKIANISKKVGYKELEQRKDLNKDIRVSILTK